MQIISNQVLDAAQFAECYTGLYFLRCDTYKETYNCLSSENIYIGKGYDFKQANNIPDCPCVIVRFCLEDNYLVSEYKIMRIQKRYLNRFLKNLNHLND